MSDIVRNSKARRDFHILETVEAGIVLRGTEVKSLRAGRGQISEAYARVENGELFLYNAHIDEYAQGNRQNHPPRAVRKLLLHKVEIRKLEALSQPKGRALIPLAFYWKHGKIKVALAVGQSKTQYDKRATLEREAAQRELKRAALHRLNGQ